MKNSFKGKLQNERGDVMTITSPNVIFEQGESTVFFLQHLNFMVTEIVWMRHKHLLKAIF